MLPPSLSGGNQLRSICDEDIVVAFNVLGVGIMEFEVWAYENPIGVTNVPTRRIKANEIPFIFIEWPLRDIEYNQQAGFLSKISA